MRQIEESNTVNLGKQESYVSELEYDSKFIECDYDGRIVKLEGNLSGAELTKESFNDSAHQ